MTAMEHSERKALLMAMETNDLIKMEDPLALAILARRLYPEVPEENQPRIPVLDEDGNTVGYEGDADLEGKDIAAGAPGMGSHPVSRGVTTVIAGRTNTEPTKAKKLRKKRRVAYKRRPSQEN